MIIITFQTAVALAWPPVLPDGTSVGTSSSADLLRAAPTLLPEVVVAETAPAVDFLYYDCQTYEPAKGLWSHWGDGLVVGEVFYSAVGDHDAPAGNAFLYAFDARAKTLTKLLDLRSVLQRPEGHYTPGKIHSAIGLGRDGWLYFSTHRGSTRVGLDPSAHFDGDWILRHHPDTGKSEIVAHAPLPMQSLPTGILDPERLIFYAGTADGLNEREPQFLAFDLKTREVLFSEERGPARAMIYSPSSGSLYFHAAKDGPAPLLRFDPANPVRLTPVGASAGLRCASAESSAGVVFTIDRNQLWAFDTKSETAKSLGPTVVGGSDYITSVDLDPKTERYLYYVPGAHGGAETDGSPVVQFDLRTNARKVICFLHPHVFERYGFIPQGSYASALSPEGDKVYIVWNGNRGTSAEALAGEGSDRIRFNTCALTVVHIPEAERRP